MKKIFKSVFAVASVLLLMTSCTDKFEDMNVSPNSPSSATVDPAFVFQGALSRSIAYRNNFQGYEQITVTTFCEFSANDTQSISDYNMPNRDLTSYWDCCYTTLTNLNMIIRNTSQVEDAQNPQINLNCMAKIWKCWIMLRLTDYLGDIPYSQAANEEGSNPKYDTQKEIYYQMFTELADAANKLNPEKANIGAYDIIYGGDVTKWKKFANSLRLRMAVRIAKVDKTKAATEAKAAIAAGAFESSADNATMEMGTETNNDYTWNPLYYGRNSDHSTVHMSLAFYNLTAGLGGQAWPTAADQAKNPNITDEVVNCAPGNHPETVDPRAPIMFGIVGQRGGSDLSNNGKWIGSEPGHSNSATLSGEMDNGDNCKNYSAIGGFFSKEATKRWVIMKYSEVCFLKAIAVEEELVTGLVAQTEYENGIKADMAYYGVPGDVVDNYLASTDKNINGTSVAYGDTDNIHNTVMDKIISQKYLAHFIEGSDQAWADHRLYHKPTLVPFANVVSSFQRSADDVANNTPKAYIKRGFYPESEQTTNTENWKAAVDAMGGKDDIQHNVWWDVD